MSVIFTAGNGATKVRYTKEQDEALISMANQEKTKEEIAAAIGHPVNSIVYRLRKLKIKEGAFVAKCKAEGVEPTVEGFMSSIEY